MIVGLESTSHSFFHVLRWARRKNDIQVRLLPANSQSSRARSQSIHHFALANVEIGQQS
jgi:hypothetical protein